MADDNKDLTLEAVKKELDAAVKTIKTLQATVKTLTTKVDVVEEMLAEDPEVADTAPVKPKKPVAKVQVKAGSKVYAAKTNTFKVDGEKVDLTKESAAARAKYLKDYPGLFVEVTDED